MISCPRQAKTKSWSLQQRNCRQGSADFKRDVGVEGVVETDVVGVQEVVAVVLEAAAEEAEAVSHRGAAVVGEGSQAWVVQNQFLNVTRKRRHLS